MLKPWNVNYQELLEKQLIELEKIGLIISDKNSMLKNIGIKHCDRYKSIIEFLRKHNIKSTQQNVELLYRADIVIRRMFLEILKPLEVQLETMIRNYFIFKSISLDNLINAEFGRKYWEEKKSITTHEFNALEKSTNKIKKAISKIIRKNKIYTVLEILSDLTYGQKLHLIKILPQSDLETFFGIENPRKHINSLSGVIDLRNKIAHHKVLVSSKISDKPISQTIESLHYLTWGNYKELLKANIYKYASNAKKLKINVENTDADIIFNSLLEYFGFTL